MEEFYNLFIQFLSSFRFLSQFNHAIWNAWNPPSSLLVNRSFIDSDQEVRFATANYLQQGRIPYVIILVFKGYRPGKWWLYWKMSGWNIQLTSPISGRCLFVLVPKNRWVKPCRVLTHLFCLFSPPEKQKIILPKISNLLLKFGFLILQSSWYHMQLVENIVMLAAQLYCHFCGFIWNLLLFQEFKTQKS